LAVTFLGLKAWEYSRHIRDGILPGPYYRFRELTGPGPEAFFNLYYVMTGLHALHVTVGVALLAWIAWRSWRLHFGSRYHTPLELTGMYWHLVDLLWLFLWPFFYLMRR
ncbi:MAG TPA: cytochrome c oxidase subunit 3, partial [Longimicrobiales bacterium]|nr:cytochrome c oxidase subunit 3 [Longimicrobiales bacterium]